MKYTYKIFVRDIYKNTSWYYCATTFTGNGRTKNGQKIKGNIKQQIGADQTGNLSNYNNIKPGIIEFSRPVTSIEISNWSFNTLCEYLLIINEKEIGTYKINDSFYDKVFYMDTPNNFSDYKILIYKDNKYFSIKEEFYDINKGKFNEVKKDFDKYGFYENELTELNNKNIIPISKFNGKIKLLKLVKNEDNNK